MNNDQHVVYAIHLIDLLWGEISLESYCSFSFFFNEHLGKPVKHQHTPWVLNHSTSQVDGLANLTVYIPFLSVSRGWCNCTDRENPFLSRWLRKNKSQQNLCNRVSEVTLHWNISPWAIDDKFQKARGATGRKSKQVQASAGQPVTQWSGRR